MFSTYFKRLVLILVFPAATGLGTLAVLSTKNVQAQSPPASDTNPSTAQVAPLANAKVKFKTPKRVADVISYAKKYGVKVEELEGDFVLGSTSIYQGNVISDEVSAKTPAQIESDIAEKRLNFFASFVASEDTLSEEERNDLKPQLDAMKAALTKRDSGPVRVLKAAFLGDPLKLKQLSQDNDVEEADVVDQESIKKKIQEESPQSEKGPQNQFEVFSKTSHLVASLNPGTLFAQAVTWWPNFGTSYVNADSTGRYTRQTMRWNANVFKTDDTYEHDFFLYNYDRSAYLDSRTGYYSRCEPFHTDWYADWGTAAAPYLDTRLAEPGSGFCEVDELPYTIGAGQPSRIDTSLSHYTWIHTLKGIATSDRFKLQAQLGYQNPRGCTSTWCSYGGRGLRILVPAWSINVPEVRQWTSSY